MMRVAGLPLTQDIKIPRLFPDLSPFFKHTESESESLKNHRNLL